MTTASPDPLDAVKGAIETQSPPRATDGTASKRRHRRNADAVSWYGRLLIFSTLLVAAGWEIFRLILAVITAD